MFRNQGLDHIQQMFADQFEPDGNNFVYRKFQKGAPVQVSAVEHDRYIETFNKHLKYGYWGGVGGMVVLIIVIAAYAFEVAVDVPELALYIGLGAIFTAFMGAYYWAWSAPARELRGRGTVGEARSRAEIRRLFLAKMTYGQIAAAVGAAAVLLLRIGSKKDLFSGWNRLWLVVAAIIVVCAAVQAFRKWRFESENK
jgi:hypothetical protein